MKTTIHRDIAMASGRWLAAIAVTVPMLSGCDLFWKPCADPSADCLMEASDGGSGTMEQAMPPDQAPPTNPRTFEWRAKVTVDPSTLKFVGMNGQLPVFQVKDGQNWECNGDKYWSHWAVAKLNLTAEKTEERIKQEDARSMKPDLPCVRFVQSQMLVSNNTFYFLASSDHTVLFLDSKAEVVRSRKYSEPASYFRFPLNDGIAVNLQPTTPSSSSVLLRWDVENVTTYESMASPATAIVLGDLDNRDPVENGMEALLFQQGSVQTVLHQGAAGSGQYTDEALRLGLDDAVKRLGKGQSVGAGFIADVDLDGQTDLVLAFGSSLYVTTYMGRDAAKVGKFRDWPKPIVALDGSEPIRSVMAVNLAQDAASELVVETDKAVHFYLNNA